LSQITTSLPFRVLAAGKRARLGSHCSRELIYRLQKRSNLCVTHVPLDKAADGK